MRTRALSTQFWFLAAGLVPLSCTFQARDPSGGDPAAEAPSPGGETTAQAGASPAPGASQTGNPAIIPVTNTAGEAPTPAQQAGSANCGPSNYPSATLSPGFMPDPLGTQGTSGGEIDATALGQSQTGPCRGWYAARPDHTMFLTQPFQFLRVKAQSAEDTTLIIRGPDGLWCSDDEAGGHDPQVQGGWVAGCYQIWVGSYVQGAFSPYQISFSERR